MSNNRLNKTIQKALKHNSSCGGRCLWLDAYNNAIFDEFAPTIRTTIQTSCMNFIMEIEETNKEPKICAMRGRADGEWHESEHEQRIECREDGVTNTITGVSKDCLLFERKSPIKVGDKYGRLLVIKKTEKRQGTNYIYECLCDCGNTVFVPSGRLGITTFSCGCLRNDKTKTHGMSDSRLYNIYLCMKSRCYNQNNPSYKHYGQRGIKICDEWMHNFDNFMKWALNNGYDENLSIDRIDNDGNYSPENCRWTDATTQANNRSVWGEIPYHGIVRDNTGYRAQVTINGKKVYIGHSVNDIEYLVELRNKYIDEHNLPCKKNIFKKSDKDNMVAEPTIIANTAGFGQCYESKEVSPTVKSSAFQYNNALLEPIEQIPLNTDQDGLATMVTTAHHYSGNIVDPKRGQKEMGVLETFNKNKEYEQRRIFEECNEANTREVLRILRQEVGEKAFLEKMGRLGRFQETEILQPRLYEESICNQGYEQPERRSSPPLCEENSLYDREQGTEMRCMRQDGCETGCTPQGRELQQQFIREFDACLSELPHETAQTEKCLHYLRKHLQSMPWLLRQTLQTMEEIREPDDSKPQIGFRVRRLTCRELFRLMDVSEEDIDKIQAAGISKTQQAKMAGNSIVCACMYHIFRKLFIDTNEENEQLSLF